MNPILQRVSEFLSKAAVKAPGQCPPGSHSHPGMEWCHPATQNHHKNTVAWQWHHDNQTQSETDTPQPQPSAPPEKSGESLKTPDIFKVMSGLYEFQGKNFMDNAVPHLASLGIDPENIQKILASGSFIEIEKKLNEYFKGKKLNDALKKLEVPEPTKAKEEYPSEAEIKKFAEDIVKKNPQDKISNIAKLREKFALSLKEAKDLVEEAQKQASVSTETQNEKPEPNLPKAEVISMDKVIDTLDNMEEGKEIEYLASLGFSESEAANMWEEMPEKQFQALLKEKLENNKKHFTDLYTKGLITDEEYNQAMSTGILTNLVGKEKKTGKEAEATPKKKWVDLSDAEQEKINTFWTSHFDEHHNVYGAYTETAKKFNIEWPKDFYGDMGKKEWLEANPEDATEKPDYGSLTAGSVWDKIENLNPDEVKKYLVSIGMSEKQANTIDMYIGNDDKATAQDAIGDFLEEKKGISKKPDPSPSAKIPTGKEVWDDPEIGENKDKFIAKYGYSKEVTDELWGMAPSVFQKYVDENPPPNFANGQQQGKNKVLSSEQIYDDLASIPHEHHTEEFADEAKKYLLAAGFSQQAVAEIMDTKWVDMMEVIDEHYGEISSKQQDKESQIDYSKVPSGKEFWEDGNNWSDSPQDTVDKLKEIYGFSDAEASKLIKTSNQSSFIADMDSLIQSKLTGQKSDVGKKTIAKPSKEYQKLGLKGIHSKLNDIASGSGNFVEGAKKYLSSIGFSDQQIVQTLGLKNILSSDSPHGWVDIDDALNKILSEGDIQTKPNKEYQKLGFDKIFDDLHGFAGGKNNFTHESVKYLQSIGFADDQIMSILKLESISDDWTNNSWNGISEGLKKILSEGNIQAKPKKTYESLTAAKQNEINDMLQGAAEAGNDYQKAIKDIEGGYGIEFTDQQKANIQNTFLTQQKQTIAKTNWDKQLEEIEGKKGTTEGGKYLDSKTGKYHYVKFPGKDRAEVESLAAKLYKLAGVDVANTDVIKFKTQDAVKSDWIEGAEKLSASQMKSKPEIVKNFAIDAWLGNWDVVGTDFDNIVVGKDGKAYRIDPGGSLYYRAQGKEKPFSNDVTELESMLNASTAPQASQVFSGVPKQLFQEGVDKLSKITDAQIDALVNSSEIAKDKKQLADTLKKRRDFIVAKMGLKQLAQEKKKRGRPQKECPPGFHRHENKGCHPVNQRHAGDPAPKYSVSQFMNKDKKLKPLYEKAMQLVNVDEKSYGHATAQMSMETAAKELGVPKEFDKMNDFCHKWQGGGYSGAQGQISIRAAVNKLKGVEATQKLVDGGYYMYYHPDPVSVADFEKAHKEGEDNYQGIIPMVVATHKKLQKMHPDGYVTVYRGLTGDVSTRIRTAIKKAKNPKDRLPVPHDGTSGYSLDLNRAASFGGTILSKKVRIEDVWIYFNTFSSSYESEQELVINSDVVQEFERDEILNAQGQPLYHTVKMSEKWVSVYDYIDGYVSKMAHLHEPSQQLPRGTKALGETIERNIYSSFRNSVNDWFYGIDGEGTADDAIIGLKKQLMQWQQDAVKSTAEDVYSLFDKGVKAGVSETGIPVDEKFYGDVNFMTYRQTGIAPAIDNFQSETFDKMSGIIRKHWDSKPGATYRLKRDLDSYLRNCRYKTERMVRTETAKVANTGMMKAWERDPDKDKYLYSWNAVGDERSKKISLLRKMGNPYSFSEIGFLWKNQKQLIEKGWQNDAFNQRCSVSRIEKMLDQPVETNRFLGRENEFAE